MASSGQSRTCHIVMDLKEEVARGASTPCGFPKPGEGDAPMFAPLRYNNGAKFYATGKQYFEEVAKAIEGATTSVFIAGWQINFDVILSGKKRLWDCLKTAVDKGCSVYVMPWFSPKMGPVDCGDFDTMLAVFQLNAMPQEDVAVKDDKGKTKTVKQQRKPLAFCLPAFEQSDQGGLGIAFAHHQKLVIVDNKVAFTGGIDLAYGRNDDEKFSLIANGGGRAGAEMYNPCVPSVQELAPEKQAQYLTRMELIAACFLPRTVAVAAGASRVVNSVKDFVGVDNARDWWNEDTWLTDFAKSVRKYQKTLIGEVQGAAVGAAASAGQSLYESLPDDLKKYLREIERSASAGLEDKYAALIAWLNNLSLEAVPEEVRSQAMATARTIMIYAYRLLMSEAQENSVRYGPLENGRTMLPRGGKTLDPETQPREPFHDVQVKIEGDSVYDLSMNFVRRWNASQKQMHQVEMGVLEPQIRWLFGDVLGTPRPKAHYIPAEHLPKLSGENKGACTMQVCRSAPVNLLRLEKAVMPSLNIEAGQAQNNCETAMMNAITAAQHFIYIEGQFFQSAYGNSEMNNPRVPSGPMGSLINFEDVPGFQQYKHRFNLAEAARQKDLRLVNWPALLAFDDEEFIEGLKRVGMNQAQIQLSQKLGADQQTLENRINETLAARIEAAIKDMLPFHIYMVLPVHPEGTLDTLNIMHQVFLTQQALMLGHSSLVNRIRRLIVARDLYIASRRQRSWDDVVLEAGRTPMNKLTEEKRWTKYLTPLNLRTWETIGGRPVTEQVYIHSKLLIADDRMAVIGSANINDRSMLGDRDTEIAVVIHDGKPKTVLLDGEKPYSVGESVHQLRCDLWKKHFGISGGVRPASSLASMIEQPANPKTWEAIQQRAQKNADAYGEAFKFIPRNKAPSEDVFSDRSLWPVWRYAKLFEDDEKTKPVRRGGYRQFLMPFDEGFWKKRKRLVQSAVTKPLELGPESTPAGVQGFIVALPTEWTRGENNISGLNQRALAENDALEPDTRMAEAKTPPAEPGERIAT